MADFTSALFLGLRHPASSLRPWHSLTNGRPSSLVEPAAAVRVASTVARRQGAPDGVLYHSTLHALSDIFGDLVATRSIVAIDDAVYPITEWAALRAVARGIPLTRFGHHDPSSLRAVTAGHGDVVVVTDGWCAGCSQPAPISELRSVAHVSAIVVDDSLAFGVLGPGDERRAFGTGGTGTVGWLGADHRGVVYVASMAKAFGVPVAVVSGPVTAIDQLRERGAARLHCSPPSNADVAAAERALHLDLDGARTRLAARTAALRRTISRAGLAVSGRIFPVVGVSIADAAARDEVRRRLERAGVRALWTTSRCASPVPNLTFLVRSTHTRRDVHQVGQALDGLPQRMRRTA
jgi:8-amino-7-oxononanoate synthase